MDHARLCEILHYFHKIENGVRSLKTQAGGAGKLGTSCCAPVAMLHFTVWEPLLSRRVCSGAPPQKTTLDLRLSECLEKMDSYSE